MCVGDTLSGNEGVMVSMSMSDDAKMLENTSGPERNVEMNWLLSESESESMM